MVTWEDLTFVYVEYANGNKGFTLYHPQTLENMENQFPGKCKFNF